MTFNIKAYPQWKKHFALQKLIPIPRPSLCRMCDRWCQHIVCQNCLQLHQTFTRRCRLCALPCAMEMCLSCLNQPPDWQACASAVTYADPWRSLIIDFKFHENPGLAKFLSAVILDNPFARELVHAADVLMPVPAATQRLRERGFNPAMCLAHALAKDRCLDDALVKWRQTPSQSGLDRARRLSNLKHSITAHPLMTRQLKSRHVVLVDDVMTTGSTLQICTQALYAAEVKRVSCVVLARAEPGSQAQFGSID